MENQISKEQYRTWLRGSSKGQDTLRRFVEREVIYCVSTLVHSLSQDPDYMENLLEVLYPQEDEGAEVFEHWIVSGLLAEALKERKEAVIDDFLALTIWGRTTTGQAIYMDSVIADIYIDISFDYLDDETKKDIYNFMDGRE